MVIDIKSGLAVGCNDIDKSYIIDWHTVSTVRYYKILSLVLFHKGISMYLEN